MFLNDASTLIFGQLIKILLLTPLIKILLLTPLLQNKNVKNQFFGYDLLF